MPLGAAIGAGVAAAGSVVTAVGAAKAAKAQRRQQKAQADRARIKQFAASRVEAGRIAQAGISSGASSGSTSSSGVSQGIGQAVQQARTNVAFVNQIDALNQRIASAKKLQIIGQGVTAVGNATGDISAIVG